MFKRTQDRLDELPFIKRQFATMRVDGDRFFLWCLGLMYPLFAFTFVTGAIVFFLLPGFGMLALIYMVSPFSLLLIGFAVAIYFDWRLPEEERVSDFVGDLEQHTQVICSQCAHTELLENLLDIRLQKWGHGKFLCSKCGSSNFKFDVMSDLEFPEQITKIAQKHREQREAESQVPA